MPFYDDSVPMGLTPQLAEPPRVTVPTPPFSRLWESAMVRESSVGSLKEWSRPAPMSSFDPSYDPFKNITGYEDYAREFVAANDDDDVMHVKSRIDAERKRTELLNDAGGLGWVAALSAGLLDPINLIPVGGGAFAVARTSATLSRMARAAQGAGRLGVAAGIGQAAQEAGLQATQITRPISESVIAVGGATPLGGLRGGFR
jgi:hypothetical protein